MRDPNEIISSGAIAKWQAKKITLTQSKEIFNYTKTNLIKLYETK